MFLTPAGHSLWGVLLYSGAFTAVNTPRSVYGRKRSAVKNKCTGFHVSCQNFLKCATLTWSRIWNFLNRIRKNIIRKSKLNKNTCLYSVDEESNIYTSGHGLYCPWYFVLQPRRIFNVLGCASDIEILLCCSTKYRGQ